MPSTLTQLRDSVPLRRLTTAEALRVAEAQANRLLRLSGQTEPPVGEEVIAQLPGIEIQRVTPAKAHAAVQWSHGRWLILLNAADQRGRQRFSLAHELKHILDHPFVTILYARQDGADEQAEQACDYFAACLLMPSRWLRQAWAEGMRDVRVLARRFGVTRQAVKVRLLQVGLIEPTDLYLPKEA
jgi:Zn-dependent peptidase ImmA (M78 family)